MKRDVTDSGPKIRLLIAIQQSVASRKKMLWAHLDFRYCIMWVIARVARSVSRKWHAFTYFSPL